MHTWAALKLQQRTHTSDAFIMFASIAFLFLAFFRLYWWRLGGHGWHRLGGDRWVAYGGSRLVARTKEPRTDQLAV